MVVVLVIVGVGNWVLESSGLSEGAEGVPAGKHMLTKPVTRTAPSVTLKFYYEPLG